MKLGLFADDLTAFLRNNESLTVILDLVGNFEKCSGLTIKSEIMFGNAISSPLSNHNFFKGIKIKKSVKILGVHFNHDYSLKWY